MYDFSAIKDTLAALGIKKGDMLYVPSDATLIMVNAYKMGVKTPTERDRYLNELIDALQQVVGEEGTLLFPVFAWDFCRGNGFNRRTSPGAVGSLNNWILNNRADFIRTQHPMYSFMVWGAKTQLLAQMDNVDGWGDDSPFAYLHHNGGKMLFLSVGLHRGFTMFHYVERVINVPYRYTKAFRGNYIDLDGKCDERVYTMYVRDLDVEMEAYLPDEWFREQGVMQEAQAGDIKLQVVADLEHACDVVADDFKNHGGEHCYKFKGYQIDWSKGHTHPDDFANGLPREQKG